MSWSGQPSEPNGDGDEWANGQRTKEKTIEGENTRASAFFIFTIVCSLSLSPISHPIIVSFFFAIPKKAFKIDR